MSVTIFRCPRCGAVSHNHSDALHGYCGRCKEFTAEPAPALASSSWCAVCGDEGGELVARPLGRGGALVNVCAACDGEHPRSGRYAFAAGGAAGPGVGPGNRRKYGGGGGA